MDFLIFITLIAIGLVFAMFGIKYYSFVILSGLTFIILGALLLTDNVTVTHYFAVTVNNTTQIVNTTTNLLKPPLDFFVPVLLILGGITEIGVNLGGRGKERGFVHG